MQRSRIMYVESKPDGVSGPAWICRVTFSNSGSSVYFHGKRLQSGATGLKANFRDVETGEEYWVSGPKRRGGDRLYNGLVEVDEDVREEYWRDIRQQPELIEKRSFRG